MRHQVQSSLRGKGANLERTGLKRTDPRPDEIKGEEIFAFVVLKGGRDEFHRDELVRELRAHVAKEIGALAKPDEIRFADNLPKTRSGKIMRRLLRDIAAGREITSDTSTLEDQKILEQLRGED